MAVDGPRPPYRGSGLLQHLLGVRQVQGLKPYGCVQYGLEEVCQGLGGERHDACYDKCSRQLPWQVGW